MARPPRFAPPRLRRKGSPRQSALGLARMVRPVNVLLAAVGVAAGALLADPAATTGAAAAGVILAAAAACLVTAFGNVLNDLGDIQVDRHAHPRRPLPAGQVTRKAAQGWALLLLAGGLALAWAAAGLAGLAFAAANAALLGLYEGRLKRGGLAGNALVAALTASTFLFGALAAGGVAGGLAAWSLAWVAAGMALFVNLAREVAKDMEDVDADRAHRTTLPMLVGARGAASVASASALVAVLVSLPFLDPAAWARACASGQAAAALVVAADLLVLAAAVWCAKRPGRAQRTLKTAMAVALAAFFLYGWPVACPA